MRDGESDKDVDAKPLRAAGGRRTWSTATPSRSPPTGRTSTPTRACGGSSTESGGVARCGGWLSFEAQTGTFDLFVAVGVIPWLHSSTRVVAETATHATVRAPVNHPLLRGGDSFGGHRRSRWGGKFHGGAKTPPTEGRREAEGEGFEPSSEENPPKRFSRAMTTCPLAGLLQLGSQTTSPAKVAVSDRYTAACRVDTRPVAPPDACRPLGDAAAAAPLLQPAGARGPGTRRPQVYLRPT